MSADAFKTPRPDEEAASPRDVLCPKADLEPGGCDTTQIGGLAFDLEIWQFLISWPVIGTASI
jgi:hypothetical protein